MGLPAGDSLVEFRDRAILKLYLYSGIRLCTGCRLKVSDFHVEGDEATIRLHEKGDKRRTIGLHYTAAQIIKEYVDKADHKRSPIPGDAHFQEQETLYENNRLCDDVPRHSGLPRAVAWSSIVNRCIYTPHSLRATPLPFP
jgi:site-specific recombinase XerD